MLSFFRCFALRILQIKPIIQRGTRTSLKWVELTFISFLWHASFVSWIYYVTPRTYSFPSISNKHQSCTKSLYISLKLAYVHFIGPFLVTLLKLNNFVQPLIKKKKWVDCRCLKWATYVTGPVFTCSKLTTETLEQCCRHGVFIVNFEHISHLVLVFLLLTLNM